ncbi:MAG: V-type ATP synthase subunit E family protein [Nanoarchaeota archaeon]
MALEQVKQEIIEHAEAEARKILANAKEHAKKEMDAAHSTLDVFDTELQESLQKELDALEKKYYASMKLASKKVLLQKQKELVDALFQELREHLAQLPKAEKTKIFASLFDAAKKQVSIGKIYCAKQDVPLVKTLFSTVEAKEIIGGIIVESKDRTLLFDYSFDSIVAALQENKLQEVTALLFKK